MIAPGPRSARPRSAASNPALNQAVRWMTMAVLAGAAVTLLAPVWWIADLAANLRIQLLIALVAVSSACLLMRSWRLSIACGLVTVWQLSWLGPFLAPAPHSQDAFATASSPEMQAPSSERLLKVCSVNVLTSNVQHERILSSLRGFDADLIAVLELSTGLSDRLVKELGDEYPHRVLQPDDGGNFGIGLLSRFPLQNVRVFELTSLPLPSISVDADWNGRPLHIIATHPIPPMNGRYFQARNEHLQTLAQLIREQRQQRPTTPVVVAGDLNVTPWSPHFQAFAQTSGLTPSWCGHWFERMMPTWYRWPAFPFGLVLDNAFSSPDLICRKREVGADTGSDHRPVYVEYAIRAEAQGL